MSNVSYNVVTKTEDGGNVYIELKDIPAIEDFTEVTYGKIALEVLKSMKMKGFLKCVVYTESSGADNVKDKTIDII